MLFERSMLRPRYALLLVALCLSGLVSTAPIRADNPPDHLASLTVSIWLEYDRPGELYIYHGELPEGTALPARISFRLPRQPSSTAAIDGEDRYRYIRPILAEDEGSYLVSYDVGWPRFQLEYYDEALRRRGTTRELEFVYRADYAVEYLVLEVKEPHGASDFWLEPAADSSTQDEAGLTVHRRIIGPVAPGQEVRWRLSYDKIDPRLASEALSLPTPATSPYEAGPGLPTRAPLERATWIVLTLVGLLGIGGLGLAWRSGNARSQRAVAPPAEPVGRRSKRSRRRRKGHHRAEEPRIRPARYCHLCGASMNKGDVFCRQCGTRRRGA